MWAMSLRISRQHLAQLLRYANSADPNECCGLMFGTMMQIEELALTQNISVTPETHFEIEPSALIAAERKSRNIKAGLIGYFHSHPNGKSRPSQIDADMAALDGRYWLIIADQQVTAWRTVPNGSLYGIFNPVELDRVD